MGSGSCWRSMPAYDLAREPSVLADEPLCLCHLAALSLSLSLSPIPALSPLWDEASHSLPTSHTEIKLKTLWEKQPFHTSRFNNSTKNHDDEEGPPRARRCARPHRRPRLGRRQLRQAVQQAPGEKSGLAFQAEGERGESREQGGGVGWGGVGWGGVTNLRRRASEEDSVARRCVPPPPPSSSLSLFSLFLNPNLTSPFPSFSLPSSLPPSPPLDQLTGARLRVPQLRRPDPRAAEGNRRVHLRQPRHCFHETHRPVLRARADLHAVQVRRRRRARVGAHARHRDVPRDAVRVPGQVCGAAERGVQGQVNIEALRLIVER